MSEYKNNLLNKDVINGLKELGSTESKSFLEEIVELYLTEAEKLIESISESITNKNFQDLNIISHTLKGASANVGASAVSKLSASIEKKAKTSDEDGLLDMFKELKECFSETKSELNNLIS